MKILKICFRPMEHILWKHFIVYGAVLTDPHFKCGSRSISYLLPLDRALNSDHFCLVKFEDPSIYSGTFWRKMDLFGKHCQFLANFLYFIENLSNFWTTEQVSLFKRLKWKCWLQPFWVEAEAQLEIEFG